MVLWRAVDKHCKWKLKYSRLRSEIEKLAIRQIASFLQERNISSMRPVIKHCYFRLRMYGLDIKNARDVLNLRLYVLTVTIKGWWPNFEIVDPVLTPQNTNLYI